MARLRAEDFMERLLQAAMRVFARKGLKRARMSDVASEMGVSHGTLYNYVRNKEALFFLLVEKGARTEPLPLPANLPVRAPTRPTLLGRLEEQLQAGFALPRLDAALKRRTVSDARAELESLVRELYERTEATRGPAAVLERSALDLPALFQAFFVRFRRDLLRRLEAYIRRRVRQGAFLSVEDPEAAARFLLETVTFFARHRYQDPDLPPGDDNRVRETVVRLMVRAFLGAGKERG